MPITVTPYIKDAARCAGPIMFPGESYAFYINAEGYLSDPDFDNFRLDIMNDVTGAVVLTDIGTLEKDVVNEYFYNIMCSFVCPVLPFGWYRLIIRDTSIADPAEGIKAISSHINIEEPELAAKVTSLIAYRNGENKYGFRYEENPTYFNRVRVPVVQVDYSYDDERKVYREVSTGLFRSEYHRTDKLVTLESYYFTETGHDAMVALYNHDTVFINNNFINGKGGYEKEPSRNSAVSKGTIDVYVNSNVPVPAQAVTPDEYLVTNEMEEITANGEQIIIKY